MACAVPFEVAGSSSVQGKPSNPLLASTATHAPSEPHSFGCPVQPWANFAPAVHTPPVPQSLCATHGLPTLPAVHRPAQYADTQVFGVVHSASTSHTCRAAETFTVNPEQTAARRHGRWLQDGVLQVSPGMMTPMAVCVTITADPVGPLPKLARCVGLLHTPVWMLEVLHELPQNTPAIPPQSAFVLHDFPALGPLVQITFDSRHALAPLPAGG